MVSATIVKNNLRDMIPNTADGGKSILVDGVLKFKTKRGGIFQGLVDIQCSTIRSG